MHKFYEKLFLTNKWKNGISACHAVWQEIRTCPSSIPGIKLRAK